MKIKYQFIFPSRLRFSWRQPQSLVMWLQPKGGGESDIFKKKEAFVDDM